MASRGQSLTLTYIAWDTSSNNGKTGDVANHTLRWIKDGTSSAPTNSASEIDATNAPGVYKITMTTAECTCDTGTLAGKSSTANVALIPVCISFEQLPTAVPGANTGLPILDSNLNVNANAKQVNGTNLTARDIGASVLISSGTGTGQLSVTSGVISSNMTQIDGALTSGNNATLYLKQLNINNNNGDAISAISSGSNGNGIYAHGHSTTSAGIKASSGGGTPGNGIWADGGNNLTPSVSGTGFYCSGGFSGSGIYAFGPNGIVADGSNAGGHNDFVGDLAGNITGSIGSVSALGSQAKIDVNTEVKDVLENDTQSEPTSVPSASSSLKDKIGWIFARLRNKQTFTKSSGVEKVYADDSVTQIGNSTDTDDGNILTKGKMT